MAKKLPKYENILTKWHGRIFELRLNRPHKRNAVCDALTDEIYDCLLQIEKEDIGALVLTGSGDHFCAGLDLAEHKDRPIFPSVKHSAGWHRMLNLVEFGPRPVVAAFQGGVIGGGLEIGSSAHVRIAEPSTFYQLPEGRRGIYVGGGASVRVSRIIGGDRMREMMLTGRRYNAEEGLALGLSHYNVGKGEAYKKALELADDIAGNAPISNYMMIQALPRIADMSREEGFLAESIASSISCESPEARAGIEAFLKKQPIRFDKKKK